MCLKGELKFISELISRNKPTKQICQCNSMNTNL